MRKLVSKIILAYIREKGQLGYGLVLLGNGHFGLNSLILSRMCREKFFMMTFF